MHQNNIRAGALAALLVAATVPAFAAGIEITGVRAELREFAPRRIEITLTMRNATGHELKLMRAESPRGEIVEMKQRSYDAEGRERLWPVAKFELPAGATARLIRDGRFIQVTGLEPGVKVGGTLPVTLVFQDEPALTLQLALSAPD